MATDPLLLSLRRLFLATAFYGVQVFGSKGILVDVHFDPKLK
jgi:hypothetical protein